MPFDPALPTDRDWLRLQIGDTTTPELLSDATYTALLLQAPDRDAALIFVVQAALGRVTLLEERVSTDGTSIDYGDRSARLTALLARLTASTSGQGMRADQRTTHVRVEPW